MSKAISFGAGVNSIAMTIMLFKRGEIYPVIFADTMAEHPETYCYMDYFEKEFMSKYGQKIVKINPFTHSELYSPRSQNISLYDYCIEKTIVPMAFKGRFCSDSWKYHPLSKYIKLNNFTDRIIGFTIDESHRGEGYPHSFPFIKENITRKNCFEIIEKEGLARPIKSGCYFCPFQSNKNKWHDLWKKYPDLFNKSEAMCSNAKTTLLPNGIALSILRESFEKQTDLFPDWDFEELEPCMCKL